MLQIATQVLATSRFTSTRHDYPSEKVLILPCKEASIRSSPSARPDKSHDDMASKRRKSDSHQRIPFLDGSLKVLGLDGYNVESDVRIPPVPQQGWRTTHAATPSTTEGHTSARKTNVAASMPTFTN